MTNGARRAEEIARAMRDALIEIGCVCTVLELHWLDGSASFVVADGPIGRMHSRRIMPDGELVVRHLSGTRARKSS